MAKRLSRSKSDKMLAGVCGGIGEFLIIDPVFVRLFFVLLTISQGIGIFVYLVLLIIMPAGSQVDRGSIESNLRAGVEDVVESVRDLEENFSTKVRDVKDYRIIIGVSLSILGLILLLQTLDVRWFKWFDFSLLWPVFLIIGGIALIIGRTKGEHHDG